jgi:hypothetical protein
MQASYRASLLSGMSLMLMLAMGPAAFGQESEVLRSDSRAPYVHRLTLYDDTGAAISPDDPMASAFSPQATCGKCHAYGTISGGWHFHEGAADVDPGVRAGRRGEPWWLVDERLGIQVPLSERGWAGTFGLADLGLTHWQFVKRFGSHVPGGGLADPPAEAIDAAPESLRWGISGTMQIDCMICHSANQRHDPSEASRQIERENFKQIPTAALGLAVIRGEARNAPDDWDPFMPPDPDYPERSGPSLVFDESRFDPDDRVLFEIVRQPDDSRCYFCHTVRPVGPSAPPPWQLDQDVHLAAGMSCVDCHRHGVDHAMNRGFEGERFPAGGEDEQLVAATARDLAVTAENGEAGSADGGVAESVLSPAKATTASAPPTAPLTCRGCHLGESGEGAAEAMAGRMGAPIPEHRGLPPLHFERLTCTACHSGPWPEREPFSVQTSLAHGLGVASKERTANDAPAIFEPVFVVQEDIEGGSDDAGIDGDTVAGRAEQDEDEGDAKGVIGPARLVWPSFWGLMAQGEVDPLSLEAVERAVAGALVDRMAPPTDDDHVAPAPLTDEEIRLVLRTLGHDLQTTATPVYIRGGYVHHADEAGALVREVHAAAAPYTWALAHDVRPAERALGSGGCMDCHSSEAPFVFGQVTRSGTGQRPPILRMHQLQGLDPTLMEVWASSFTMRTVFKVVSFCCVGVLTIILLYYGATGVGAVLRIFR